MSALGGLGVDADAGGSSSMLPSPQPSELGKLSSLPVDPVASYVASPVSPYPTIVDPFKRRTALREYFRGIRGENKENERVNEADMMKSSPTTSLPKQKTLGLCRRHVVSTTTVAVSSEGKMRDKRKFNAPRQTPEKRQRPVEESDFEAELPRRPDVINQMVVEDVNQFVEHVELDDQALIMAEAEVQRSQMLYAKAENIASSSSSSSILRQAQQDSPSSLSFKPQIPTIRKPLTPVNMNRQQASQVHTSPMPWQPNFAAVVEREDNVSGESLFQLASGKRYQPSAAAKARAASLFESDADLADLPSFD